MNMYNFPETILEKLIESECRWVFCDTENAVKFRDAGEKAPWPVTVVVCGPGLDGFENFSKFYEDDGTSCPKPDLSGDDISVILPTSGTTGSSKGAAHTHKIFLNSLRIWAGLHYSKDKPNVIASKGTHISGMMMPYTIMIKGAKGIVLPRVSKEILIKTVDKYKARFWQIINWNRKGLVISRVWFSQGLSLHFQVSSWPLGRWRPRVLT